MNTFLDSSRATSTLKGRVINWSKSRLSFPGHVPGAVTLQYDALYGRLEEAPDGVGADGREEAKEHHVLVQPCVHAKLLDAARVRTSSS